MIDIAESRNFNSQIQEALWVAHKFGMGGQREAICQTNYACLACCDMQRDVSEALCITVTMQASTLHTLIVRLQVDRVGSTNVVE